MLHDTAIDMLALRQAQGKQVSTILQIIMLHATMDLVDESLLKSVEPLGGWSNSFVHTSLCKLLKILLLSTL
jgi:hypothetical protein